jgi:hypothetical protein
MHEDSNTKQQEYPTYSTLVTEPLHPGPVTPQLQRSSLQQVVETPEKKRHTALWVVIILLAVVIGIGAYWYLNLGRVTVSNLVEEKVQNTTYLRPQQWKSLNIATSSFGDKLGKDGKSTGLVAVNVSATSNTILATASGSTLDLLRTTLLNAVTEETLTPAFQTGGAECTSAVDIQKEVDASSTTTSMGMYTLTATCKRNGEPYIMKMHCIAGRDGYLRTITVFGGKASWDRNTEAYQKILDSIQQKMPSA